MGTEERRGVTGAVLVPLSGLHPVDHGLIKGNSKLFAMSEASESDSEYSSSDEEVSTVISALTAVTVRHSNLTSFTCPAAGGLRAGTAEAGTQRRGRGERQTVQELRRE